MLVSGAAIIVVTPLITTNVAAQPMSNGTNSSTISNETAGFGASSVQSGSLPQSCSVVIRSPRDFEQLQSGDTGCVPSNATIEMPMSAEGTVVPRRASLLSGGGTLVYSGSPNTPEMSPKRLLTLRSNTRVRGLNIVGPIAGREVSNPWRKGGNNGRDAVRSGVTIVGRNVDISFVTVRGWPNTAITLAGNATASIDRSRVIGQYTTTRGYGVSVNGNSTAHIATSYFNRNRHSLKAGDSGSYTIVNSIIGPASVSHSLDVHPPAGGRYVYRNLTVMNDDGLAMRQIPQQGALLENVWFTRAEPGQAIYQLDQRECDMDGQTHCDSGPFATAADGYEDFRNMRFRNIHYGSNPPPGVGAPVSMPKSASPSTTTTPSTVPSTGTSVRNTDTPTSTHAAPDDDRPTATSEPVESDTDETATEGPGFGTLAALCSIAGLGVYRLFVWRGRD